MSKKTVCRIRYDTYLEPKKKFGYWGVKVECSNGFVKLYTGSKYNTSHPELALIGLNRIINVFSQRNEIILYTQDVYLNDAIDNRYNLSAEGNEHLNTAEYKQLFEHINKHDIEVVYDPDHKNHTAVSKAIEALMLSKIKQHDSFGQKKKDKANKKFSKYSKL